MQEPTDRGVIRLNSVEDFIEITPRVIKPALRSIDILTPDLEKPWLGSTVVVESLKAAVIRNRRIHVRCLIADPTLAVKTDHPLLGLIRKLSRIEARVISNELQEKQPLKNSMLLVDRSGVVLRQSNDAFIGFGHFDDKQTVKRLKAEFELYWRYSETNAYLRAFSL